jgi:cytochrome c556
MITALGIVLALGAVPQAASADAHFEKAVKARQAFMRVYAFNIGLLGAMAKGDIPYDAKLADAAANNLLAASNMKNAAMWPKGSDADSGLGVETRAKPEIWDNFPKVREKHQNLTDALTKMAAVAGNGLDSVRANMKAVGGGCKGCHEDFRVPKDK